MPDNSFNEGDLAAGPSCNHFCSQLHNRRHSTRGKRNLTRQQKRANANAAKVEKDYHASYSKLAFYSVSAFVFNVCIAEPIPVKLKTQTLYDNRVATAVAYFTKAVTAPDIDEASNDDCQIIRIHVEKCLKAPASIT